MKKMSMKFNSVSEILISRGFEKVVDSFGKKLFVSKLSSHEYIVVSNNSKSVNIYITPETMNDRDFVSYLTGDYDSYNKYLSAYILGECDDPRCRLSYALGFK